MFYFGKTILLLISVIARPGEEEFGESLKASVVFFSFSFCYSSVREAKRLRIVE